MTKKKLLSLVFIVLSLLLIGAIFSWFVGHGRLEINLPAGSKSVTIQSDEKTETFKTEESVFSKTLSSNNYLVTVKLESESESFITNQSIGRFLKLNTISAELKPESGRAFVGDNPLTCSEFLGSTLVTYLCNGPLGGMVMHIPATSSTPTYTKSVQLAVNAKQFEEVEPLDVGTIEGVINIGTGLTVLTYKFESGRGFHNVFNIKIVNNSFDIEFVKRLESLDSETFYTAQKNNGALLLANEGFTSIYKGTNFDDLEIINPNIEQKNGMVVSSVDIDEAGALVGYNEDIIEDNEVATNDQSSIISVNRAGDSVSKKYSTIIAKLKFCGNYVCALDSLDVLRIYSLDMVEIAKFNDVLEFDQTNDSVVIATKTEVINLDKSDLNGFIGIAFDDSKFTSLSVNSRGVVLALNSGGRNRALVLDNNTRDYPDKDLAPILNTGFDYINSVSVYNNSVFISPELGERVYVPETGKYDYPQETKDTAKLKINELLNTINLDKSKYSVKINGL